MTALVPLEAVGKEIKARIEAGDKAVARAEDHYIAAGIQLAEAKKRLEAEGGSFKAFLSQHDIGRSRAYDILAVADGRKTFAGIRAKDAERQARKSQKTREAIESVSHGHDTPAWHGQGTPFAPVEDNLPDDLCARAWAYKLCQMQPKSSEEWSYHGLCHAFARLSPAFRMRVLVDWFSSLAEPEQLEFHDKCPSPAMPEYMGDWLVEALMSSVDYRPKVEVTDEVKQEMAFAEMDKVIEVYRSWLPADREKFEGRHSDTSDFIPAFLRKTAA